MSSKEQKEKIWQLIKDTKVGMLTTQVGNSLHSRPMHIVQDSYDGNIFFFTDVVSEKNFEIGREDQVCVTFSNSDTENYVSLTGTATLRRDQDLIDKHWNSMIGSWFPEGKESSRVGFLDIKVQAGEYWDGESSRILQIYELAKAKITGERPEMGENSKFGSL
ncbi:pyridoxamine 5'-phosphate oxidase family protein [Oligoflexaceae bacterium]|nr:pyridoxamine 5'-phosphate oxidase family protein [Oligoflexaceae bacterium]